MSLYIQNNLKFKLFLAHEISKTSEQIDLHNKVYKFWVGNWKAVFDQSGSPESLDADDFFRQQYVQVLMLGDDVVGCSFSTLFNLKANFQKDHSYFRSFSPEVYRTVEGYGCESAMTIEYLTAHRAYRKREIGFSLGAVLTGIGLKLMEELKADVVFGAPRKDIRINQISSQQGFQTLLPSIIKCNYECELVGAFKNTIQRHPDVTTRSMIEKLWQERFDLRSHANAGNYSVRKAS